MDHVAPVSLYRTWAESALVLACRSCNDAKSDGLPLSFALLLCSRAWASVHGASDDVALSTDTVNTGVHEPIPLLTAGAIELPLGLWRLLARLAHAHQAAFTAVWRPNSTDAESTPDLRDCARHARRHTPVTHSMGRPDCLRAPRPVRTCSRSTGEAVPA